MTEELNLGPPPAVVVDSPLPVAGGAPEIPVADAPAVEAAPADEIAQLSAKYGVDLTGFSSVQDAKNHVRVSAELYAQDGLRRNRQQPEAQPAPAAVEAEEFAPEDFGFEEGEVSPKVAAVLKKLQEQNLQALKESKAIRLEAEKRNQQERIQAQAEVWAVADEAIDSWSSEKYGATGKRNAAQTVAFDRLNDLALGYIRGKAHRGESLPTMDKVMEIAALLDGTDLSTPSPAPAVAPPHSLEPRPSLPLTPSPRPRETKGGSEAEHLMRDPDYMAGARALLQRGH